MVRILVVEDNAALRRLMGIHLRRAGYTVLEAENGAAALELLEHERVQLIISDIMMPVTDGLELTDDLRRAGDNTPILLVTVKSTLEDKRSGFHAGADDYLTKPVDFEELLLRVEALLRRCGIRSEGLLRAGDCVLRADTLQLTGPDLVIDLRPKEYALLEKLLSAPQKIFTRQMLMDDLWGYDSESDPRTVDTHIRRLRDKLSAVSSFEIQTVRGLGYRVVMK